MKKVLLSLAILAFLLMSLIFVINADGTSPEVSFITIERYPDRTVYDAFESFDPGGLIVSATLKDGSRITIPNAELGFSYERGDCFRAGDSNLLIYYGGRQVRLPITVNRIGYPLDTAISDVVLTYNGDYQSYTEALPTIIGRDGIPLKVMAVGGGCDVGEYEVFIEFSTDSSDYLTPESRVAKMTIDPLEVLVSWRDVSFIYDGKSKIPTAEYTDAKGETHRLSVLGGAINAGNYTARVSATDPNYRFTNTSIDFEIRKADYDMSEVYWSGKSFVYDGNKRSVTLHGLPRGVSVVGYEGDVASDAGKYSAKAILSWDKANYNAPIVADYSWEIMPADYDVSGFKFVASTYTYDGRTHYPNLEGAMPVGADGIALEYDFSCGATHVDDGIVSVIISFKTASKNYNLPKDHYSSVKITPLGINVTWTADSLYYTGERQAPAATARECSVKVSGGALTVGKYKATAESLNSDYYVINSSYDYSILKAENSWKTPPSVSTCYEGREIKLIGESRFGEVSYSFFSDPSATEKIPTPTAVGKYYARLSVADTMNYGGLQSGIIAFEIIPIKPVSFVAEISKGNIVAFSRLSASDLVCLVINNDGSREAVDPSLVKIIYQNGDSLRKNDDTVTLMFEGFSLALPIEVGYADYDLSEVSWENTVVKYNGRAQAPTLSGLPEGVSLVGTTLVDMIDAGIYTVSARLSYDSENYNPPTLPSCRFTIERQELPAPKITSVYSGKYQMPISDSLLYYVEGAEGFRDAGIYSVTLRIADPKNYCFKETHSDRVNAIFEITPATISVKIGNRSLHLFEGIKSAEYSIVSGRVFDGDFVGLGFYLEGNKILAISKNPNYVLDVQPGRMTRLPYPTLVDGLLILAILFAVFTLVFCFFLLYKKRGRLATVVGIIKCRIRHRHFKAGEPVDEPRVIPTPITEEKTGQNPFVDDDITISVDEPHADMLITDPQAKSLIKREGDVVYTDGTAKVKITVGELSDAFSDGDSVDINSLKERGLAPNHAGSLKVVGGGKIDKALTVFANDFTLSAVKMLALSGGKAIKCITLKGKPISEKE